MPNKFDNHALRLFNAGFLSSRIGEWLYTLALNWLVLVETSSPLLLAVINACRLLPALVLSIPSGQLADRFEQRRLNSIVAALNTLVVALTGVAFYFKLPFSICALLVLARAALMAAEAPIRNAFMCGTMEGNQLRTAVAQNASIMNLGRIIGPVLAGLSLAHLGGLGTFLLAAGFCGLQAVQLEALTVSCAQIKQTKTVKKQLPMRRELAEKPQLGRLFYFGLTMMFFGFPYTAMLPIFSELVLKLGAEELGYLMSISALGALIASSFLGLSPEKVHWSSLKREAILFGIALTAFGFSANFWTAALTLFAVGFFGQAYRTSSRMMFQDLVSKESAGRMMGLALMDRGMIPLGALLIGVLAEYGGARMGFVAMGFGALISVFLFSRGAQNKD